jgi:hypothetical protein
MYNHLPEDEPSGTKHVEDFVKNTNTGMPPYPLIQYLWIQLSAVHRGPKKLGN